VLLRRGDDTLVLHEWSDDGQLLREARWEESDLAVAMEELDAWYVEQRPGANLVSILASFRMLARMSGPDAVERALDHYDEHVTMIDHRPMGWPVQDLDGLRARFRTVGDERLVSNNYVARLLHVDGPVRLADHVVAQRRGSGSWQATRSLIVGRPSRHSGLTEYIEQFPIEAAQQAVDRFEELADEWRRHAEPSNTASLTANRAHTWARDERRSRVGELFSPDVRIIDSAGNLLGDRDTVLDATRTGIGVRARHVLAVRGEHLALMAWSDADLDGEPFWRVALVEVDHRALIESVILFEWTTEGLIAAADILDERTIMDPETSAVERINAEFTCAARHLGSRRFEDLLAEDFRYADRRMLGWGDLDKSGLHALGRGHGEPPVSIDAEVLGSTDSAAAARTAQWIVKPGGLDEAIPGLYVTVVRDGLIAYMEGQVSEDPADALIRMAELTIEGPPAHRGAPSRH
jgi:hypothetical protein